MKKLFRRDMVFTILVLILAGLNVYYYIVPDAIRSNEALTFAIIILITVIVRLYLVIDKNIKLENNGSNNIS